MEVAGNGPSEHALDLCLGYGREVVSLWLIQPGGLGFAQLRVI